MRKKLSLLIIIVGYIFVCSSNANAQQQWDYLSDYLITDSNNQIASIRDIKPRYYENDTLRIYSDFLWKNTIMDRAAIYTIAYKEGRLWHCFDYAMNGMILLRDGYFSDKKMNLPDSVCTWYYANEQIRTKCHYKDGKKNGLWLSYKSDFTLMDSALYRNDYIVGRAFCIKEDNSKEIYQMDTLGKGSGYVFGYDTNNVLNYKGKYKDGLVKDSIWVFYRDDKVWHKTFYKNGDTLKEECYNKKGELMSHCKTELAKYPGGSDSLNKFLGHNIRYPQAMIDQNIQGKVVVQFVIKKDGSISDVNVLYSPSSDFSAEVKRVLSIMPKWIPGKAYGEFVNVYYKLPVAFHLQE